VGSARTATIASFAGSSHSWETAPSAASSSVGASPKVASVSKESTAKRQSTNYYLRIQISVDFPRVFPPIVSEKSF
jgi:hypothetical protein